MELDDFESDESDDNERANSLTENDELDAPTKTLPQFYRQREAEKRDLESIIFAGSDADFFQLELV